MDVEWEGVTAGEGVWWTGPPSLDIMGDSVFTALDVIDVTGLGKK